MTTNKATETTLVKKPSLMQYALDRRDIIEKIIEHGGEITPEDDAALVEAGASLEMKTSGYLAVMDQLEAFEAYAKEQAAIASGYAKSCATMIKSLRERLAAGLKLANLTKIKAGFRTVSLQTFEEDVVIEDLSKIPADLADIDYKEIIKPHLVDIKLKLQAGHEVPGAKLDTKPDGIRITKARKAAEVETEEAPAITAESEAA